MAERVRTLAEISINGVRYPLGGDKRVHSIVSSQYPQKQVFGDIDKDSNPRTSIVVWDDWRGGVGLYSTDGKEGLNRSSFSRADGRYKDHLMLPPLPGSSAEPPVAGYIGGISELGSKIYATLNNGIKIYSWTPSSDTWSGLLATLSSSCIDALAFTLGGTDYMAFVLTNRFIYSSDGSAWTEDLTDVVSLSYWDNRLWGIDETGQLWFSTTIGTTDNDAKIELPDHSGHNLFVGPDAKGEDILYVGTAVGLFAHDAANSRFVRTKVQFPLRTSTSTAGAKVVGAATWNGDIYICPGKMSVYRYDPVRGLAVSMGLDKNAGISNILDRGDITALIPTHTGLIAIVHATSDLVWEYNGIGWHYLTETSGEKGSHHISDIGGNYRYYHGTTGFNKLGYVTLQTGQINPDIDAISYDGTNDVAVHITPWFNAGQNEIDKLAVRVRIECTGMTSTETAKVEFGLNYSSLYEDSTFTVSTNGSKVTTNTFPLIANNNNEAGSVFRAIRFKLTLNRGSTATLTPNVKSLSLEWRRKIPARYGFTCDIDRTRRYGNRSPKQLKAALITAVEKDTQVEAVWVDDDGDTQNYFVDIVQMEDIQQTGRDEAGVTRITALEN